MWPATSACSPPTSTGRPRVRPRSTAGPSTPRRARWSRIGSTTAVRSSPGSMSAWSAGRTATATPPGPARRGSSKGALLKYDLERGTSEAQTFGNGQSSGEGVFVPRSDDAAEDDGWVMSLVYDRATDRSDLVILDAQDFSGEPVAGSTYRSACPSASTATGCPTSDGAVQQGLRSAFRAHAREGMRVHSIRPPVSVGRVATGREVHYRQVAVAPCASPARSRPPVVPLGTVAG